MCLQTFFTAEVDHSRREIAVVVPPLLVMIVSVIPAFSPLPAGMFALQAQWLDMLIALPVTLLIAIAAIDCGKVFGDIWYMNKR
ncbi:MAG: hypothetical protein E6I93_09025 [Chloroflexi bacterium]|nr:MAG: hypothetical protein E6I93_09025 [Chloroflexota bacterium]